MLGKKLSLAAALTALVLTGPARSQPQAEDEAALEQTQAERELALEDAATLRELAAQESAAERELASQAAAAQRDYEVAQREFAREMSRTRALTAAESANMQRELSQARNELARTVADVARIQAQVREPALQDLQRKWRFVAAGQPVLGLNIEDSDFGVFVRGVTPNGPAATAGVEEGDTIVAINDVELARAGDQSPSATLLGQIGNVVPGDDVKLRILRGGDFHDFVVEAGANGFRAPYVNVVTAPGTFFTHSYAPFRYTGAWNDIELASLTPALGEYFGATEGLLVVRAGRAAELGFQDGDVIIDLAGRKPQSPEHAMRIIASFEPGEMLQAAIMRQRRREMLTLTMPARAPGERGDGVF